jgi:hypothetical protein
MESNQYYSTRTPKNYPEGQGCFEVVWKQGFFMPFDIISGLDGCPPDNGDYKKYKKTHWWVCPKTTSSIVGNNDISGFIDLPISKSFKTVEDAVKFCLKWREKWLKEQINF